MLRGALAFVTEHWKAISFAWCLASAPLGILTGRWLRSRTIEFAADRDDRP